MSLARQYGRAATAKVPPAAKGKKIAAKAIALVEAKKAGTKAAKASKRSTKRVTPVTRARMDDESPPKPSSALLRTRLVAPAGIPPSPVTPFPPPPATKGEIAALVSAVDTLVARSEEQAEAIAAMTKLFDEVTEKQAARIAELERAFDAMPMFSTAPSPHVEEAPAANDGPSDATAEAMRRELKPAKSRAAYMKAYRERKAAGG